MEPLSNSPLPLTPDFRVEPLAEPLRLPRFSLPFKIMAVLVGLVVLGGVVYLFFGTSSYSDANVVVMIASPHDAASGDQVVYKVTFQNKNKTALNNARLVFYYPPESIPLHEGSVADITNETIQLGTLPAQSKGDREFVFLIVGAQGDIKSSRVVLTYTPEGLPSEIPRSAEATTMVASLAVPLSVVAPPSVISGQAITYYIDYRNQSSEALSALRLHVKYPEGFTPTLARKEVWEIPMLAVGDSERIEVAGVLTGRARDDKKISVVMQKQIATPEGMQYVNFESAHSSSVIAAPPLSADILLQDSTTYIAHIKELMKYKIVITNNSDSDLSNLTLSVKLEGAMFDTTTIQSTGYYDGRLRAINWTSAVVPELGFLRAHGSVTVPFMVSLKSGFVGGADSFIKTSVHAETPDVPESYQGDTLSADVALITRVSTSPTFSQRVAVSDTQWGKLGPYPPKVDQETGYTVRWSLANPSSDLYPAKVTAVLMPGVIWKNQTRSLATPTIAVYNAKLNTLTWDVGAVPAGTGVSNPAYETFFQVSVTPSSNHVGGAVPLIKNVVFEGIDVKTNEKISRSAQDIDTLSVEDVGRSGGSVEP